MPGRNKKGCAKKIKWWGWAGVLLALVVLIGVALSVRGEVRELINESKARPFQSVQMTRPPDGTDRRSVELIYQNPELPNGCEVTSLAMLLNWAGMETDKLELYELLPSQTFTSLDGTYYGVEPEAAYVGDAASVMGGWYCFEGPVIEAGNAWLEAQGSSLKVEKLSGLSRSELERYLSAGVPLAAWVTLKYQEPRLSTTTAWVTPDGTLYTPYSNLHCVVAAGIEDGGYLTADPIEGWTLVDADAFWEAFEAMGSRAVAVAGVTAD